MRCPRGFTLVEMLVALSVFALVGVISARLVSSTVENHARVSERDGRLVEMQRAMLMIKRDLIQLSSRGIRDMLGDPMQPLLIGSNGAIEFTRTGWRNPLQHKRAELQRVAYTVEEGDLYRLYWNVLDRAQDSEPFRQKLLTKVKQAEFVVFDASGDEHAFWPRAEENADEANASVVGLMVRLEIEPFGEIERLWSIPVVGP
ncbi:MAG: type II secretion system minor pseudopilin GspJ [Pseudomonadales bacterium]|jgi:general secretion pathway protein J|nr:type II secretion system minor pseudopilin GspJ [Pseudomonadales bacterium]MDP6473032.1 type II secretion system minor pseudopilin GspJ [Pseudomonadales bacterium]MDP6826211.1 type II secretion system minor pseudopilin GspJ [Pseudomonadales bacterium]MDP6973330.1 type II secretion system minor pseudopilin GspJ [Pseudomonadales bacterium]|tara:strand:- start:439 stop:1044 length:606 start_codon:yes stop_codon:yes gene_type:complete